MPFPKQSEVEVPLLTVIRDCGGSARPRDIYPKLTSYFPGLTPEEQDQRLESSPATRKWWNLVQWVRQHLVETGDIDGTTRGVWKITDQGKQRLEMQSLGESGRPSPAKETDLTLRGLSNRSRDDAKMRLL